MLAPSMDYRNRRPNSRQRAFAHQARNRCKGWTQPN